MLKSVPLPPGDRLTARARAFAYPEFSAAARAIIAANEAEATQTQLHPPFLLEAARRQTGLADFGNAPLVEPLNALCRSLREELEFHALGKFYLFRQLLGLLSMRLRLVDLWTRRPEILELPIERPLIVIGLPRSGTTILHRLLARDPMLRSAPFWELSMPLPPGDPEAAPAESDPGPDPRIALVQSGLDTLHTMAPDLAQMHEIQVDEPDEDISLLVYAFSSMLFEWSYMVPGYSRYYRSADQTEGYRFFKRVLQTLQWLRGGRRWVLKAPQHLEQLGPLLTVFPDATLIQTHRDPVTAIVSLASLTTYGVRRYFDHPNPHAIGGNIADIVERLLRAGVAGRAGREGRFVDIAFADLLADPIGCVRSIYAASDDVLTGGAEARMQSWIADNRQDKHGGHDYAAEDFGLDVDALRGRLKFYQDRFDVPTDRRFVRVAA
jgi:hypothetical protein